MNQIGVIGLGVMGRNIALNMLNHNFKVSGYNRTYESTKKLIKMNIDNFQGYEHIEDFVNSLEKPRKIFLMVSAGKAVDAVVERLVKLLEPGDIIMDGGNSFFKDTERRSTELAKMNIHYFGVGVSGGEEGALKGPSIMPSGDAKAYQEISPILEAISAKYHNDPCCTYIGEGGSGHYVKMVHNGIEYADMQLLAETYLILKKMGKYSNREIAEILDNWNQGEANSYLVEITSIVLKEKDEHSDNDLVDMILDVAGNKGTGRWTSIEALAQEYNASLLTAAYQARIMSNNTNLREKLHNIINDNNHLDVDLEDVHQAYLLAKSLAFIQGFGLYHDASDKYNWNLNYKNIAAIFRAGCIIQAKLLQKIMNAYDHSSDNLLLNDVFVDQIKNNHQALKNIVLKGLGTNLPLPVFTNALLYLNQLSTDLLGANIIQAQRDYFGAHTYQRIDRNGFEHHNWNDDEQ